MNKTPLSKKELVERLKAIANDNSPRPEIHGAMCYSPIAPPRKHCTCDICQRDIEYDDWGGKRTIFNIVYDICRLGYDAKVEIACKSCALEIKKKLYPDSESNNPEYIASKFEHNNDIPIYEMNYIFYFRISDNEDYHCAISDNTNKYRAVLSFLNDSKLYTDSYDNGYYLADEVKTIEFMTGIKINS